VPGDHPAGGTGEAVVSVSSMSSTVRSVAGPAMRRLRREWQWRHCGDDLGLHRAPATACPYPVVDHATPLFRTLSGLDDQLQRNKVVNLSLAAERLDGLVVAPGQRLSFWRQVRRPAARRGFLDGLVLDAGRLTSGVGGGLCQLSNLLYWLTLHTPLTVAERWRHTYDVFPDSGRSQPFGTGATCAWPSLDLQIANGSDTTFRLSIEVTATQLVGAWTADRPVLTGYQVYETDHVMVNDAPGVFTRRNIIRRRVLNVAGEQIADELVTANHALLMYQPFLDAGRSPQPSGS
jgi:vancomycin resistance protein VanW